MTTVTIDGVDKSVTNLGDTLIPDFLEKQEFYEVNKRVLIPLVCSISQMCLLYVRWQAPALRSDVVGWISVGFNVIVCLCALGLLLKGYFGKDSLMRSVCDVVNPLYYKTNKKLAVLLCDCEPQLAVLGTFLLIYASLDCILIESGKMGFDMNDRDCGDYNSDVYSRREEGICAASKSCSATSYCVGVWVCCLGIYLLCIYIYV